MNETFVTLLAVGGKANSLGKVNDVIEMVLNDTSRLGELYDCLFCEDAWVRMRAADALEKICRDHPDWIAPYIDRFVSDKLVDSDQPSIQWHLAQMYREVELTDRQKHAATQWLVDRLSTKETDWIVAANAMDTLAAFVKDGSFPAKELIRLVKIQQNHKSKSVVRRADKLLTTLQ